MAAAQTAVRPAWPVASGQWQVAVTLPTGDEERQLAIIDRQLGVRAQGIVRGSEGSDVGPLEYDIHLCWETISTVSYRLRGGGGAGEGQRSEYSSGLLRLCSPDDLTAFDGLAVSTTRAGGDLLPIAVTATKL
ncbi:MAG: hypothetical protein GY939_28770 [Actinomycetia bacterium]|nr:hypothetical protein [Actinomycetes bacterium]